MDEYGGPEVVTLRDLPTPAIGPQDILIEVRAASVNPVDFKMRDGQTKFLVKNTFPLVLGCDLSGVVARIGSSVTRFKRGDDVFVRLSKGRIGAFAELAVVDQVLAAPKPKNLTYVEAASIPLVGLTSWQALIDIGKVKPKDKVLIHAGSGGVGTFAIQLAKHLGAHVTTTASERNTALVSRLGADVVIDYKKQRFEEVAAEYDVIYDTQGGETLERSFAVVKRGGVVVTIAGKPDAKFAKAWGLNPVLVLALRIMMRKVTRLARTSGSHFEFLFMRPDGVELAKIGELLECGVIKPVVDRTFPFDQTKEALAYVESGKAVGKVVIEGVS